RDFTRRGARVGHHNDTLMTAQPGANTYDPTVTGGAETREKEACIAQRKKIVAPGAGATRICQLSGLMLDAARPHRRRATCRQQVNRINKTSRDRHDRHFVMEYS